MPEIRQRASTWVFIERGKNTATHLALIDFSLSRAPKIDLDAGTVGYVDPLARARYTIADRAAHDVHFIRWLVDTVVRAVDPVHSWKWYCDQAQALRVGVSALGGGRLCEQRHVRA